MARSIAVLCMAVALASPPALAQSVQPMLSQPRQPAVVRGGDFMGFAEQFNRYYTDRDWRPSKTVFVSPDGGGDGSSRDAPISVGQVASSATPGTRLYFTRGEYKACVSLEPEQGGTYDQPVVLYGERNEDGSLGVRIDCCDSGRKSCFNLENANHVAVDGFEMAGGVYGVRVVGADFAQSSHARGIAVLNSVGHDQERDPFFSGHTDWAVWENNVAFGARDGDGHGMYLSNGGDWNVVRFNETYANVSSDFQINPDPQSTCAEVDIDFADPRCDAVAGTGEGGQGASDYFLVEGNYFHDSLGPGPNFTSTRRSVVRNNIFGPQARHNASFWQETENPKLAATDNVIVHNLFITTERHGVQFSGQATRNIFANNLLVGIKIEGDTVSANPDALLMEVDETAKENIFRGNVYVSGRLEGRDPNPSELVRDDFSPAWFAGFPAALQHDPNAFAPVAGAPWLDIGEPSPDATEDRNGIDRSRPVDPGPFELK